MLEAGSWAPDELRINVPGMRGSALGSIYDWNFTTIPQTNLAGRTVDVNRGHVLGGSSALNYLCYDRAASAEYDAWGELGEGLQAWNWEVMKKAMVKSENFTGNDGDLHGRAGPIRSTYNRIVPEVLKSWQPTMKNLNVPINDGGSLGGDPIGAMFQPTNIDTRHWNRSYAANSYLLLAGPNLEVQTKTRVTKIDFAEAKDQQPLRAIGVTLDDGTKVTARGEVVLSAGSVQSPGLLELSGIGQSDVLKAAGITPILDLPGVGENYQDHIRISNTYRLKEGMNLTSIDPLIHESSGALATEQMQFWLDGKSSWYDYTTTAYAYLNWRHISNKTDSELLRIAKEVVAKNENNTVDLAKLDFLQNSDIPQLELILENNYVSAQDYPGGKWITLIATVMHPFSRGSVHIDPASPLGKPRIDPQYMSNEYDMRALIEGAKYSRRIAQTEPMASLWDSEFDPGRDVKTDAQWRDFATKSVLSFYHPVGTCAMLPRDDGGVVNASLIVHGTSNLRIVDASIMPVQISAHIQTAVYGIAEVAAEMMIREATKGPGSSNGTVVGTTVPKTPVKPTRTRGRAFNWPLWTKAAGSVARTKAGSSPTKVRPVNSPTQARPVSSPTPARPVSSAAPVKPASSAVPAKPISSVTQAKPASSPMMARPVWLTWARPAGSPAQTKPVSAPTRAKTVLSSATRAPWS